MACPNARWFWQALGLGFGLGLCLLVGVASLAAGASWLSAPTPTAVPPPPATRRPTPTPPPPTATLTNDAALLQQAAAALDTDPETTLALLTPHLEQFSTPADQQRAYRLVADAYLQLGRYQFAAAYFKQLYAQAPSAEVLFQLASAYDLGGDLENALVRYYELLQWPERTAADYYPLARSRIQHLEAVLGTATPTPSEARHAPRLELAGTAHTWC